MNSKIIKLRTGILFASVFMSAALLAQETTDLTGQDLTVDALVDALAIPTRGIGAKCAPYQAAAQPRTRGIGVAANSVAAVQEMPEIKPVKTASVTATFEINSADLTPEAKGQLSTLADALNSQTLASQCFQLAGHTCDLGEGAYNLELSKKRAAAVKEFLVQKGVDGSRLITTGFGESSPLVPNTDESARQKNRRVDVGALPPPALEYQ